MQAEGEVVDTQRPRQDPHRPARRDSLGEGGDDQQIKPEGDQYPGLQDVADVRRDLPVQTRSDEEANSVGDAKQHGQRHYRPSTDDRADGDAIDQTVQTEKGGNSSQPSRGCRMQLAHRSEQARVLGVRLAPAQRRCGYTEPVIRSSRRGRHG